LIFLFVQGSLTSFAFFGLLFLVSVAKNRTIKICYFLKCYFFLLTPSHTGQRSEKQEAMLVTKISAAISRNLCGHIPLGVRKKNKNKKNKLLFLKEEED